MLRGKQAWALLIFFCCALLFALASGVHANEGSGAEEGVGVKTLFGTFADVAIWTIVVFIVLLLVLGKYAWKPMMEGLDRRERSIHDALAEAKKAREDAEQLRAMHQQQLAKAQEEVRAIIEEGRRSAQQVSDDMIARARSEAQAERDRSRREMEIARDQALQQLTDWSAQLATMISAKALERQITLDDHRRLVDEALKEMKHTNGGLQRQMA